MRKATHCRIIFVTFLPKEVYHYKRGYDYTVNTYSVDRRFVTSDVISFVNALGQNILLSNVTKRGGKFSFAPDCFKVFAKTGQ